nr:hypothetical protein [Geomicrobium sp. JCM 19055]
MKKFHEMEYDGINVEEIQNKTYAITDQFQKADSFDEQNRLLHDMNEIKKRGHDPRNTRVDPSFSRYNGRIL